MSQRSRPDGDVYTGGWSPTPLWEQLSEPPPPHDGTFIASPSLPPGRTFTVALDPLAAPIAGVPEDEVRPHELVVRLDGTGCGPRALVVLINTLHGEDRWIKSQLFDLGPGFQSYTLALSYREAARIEDYAALKVLVAASADLCPGEGGSSSSSSSQSLSLSASSSGAPSLSPPSGGNTSCCGVLPATLTVTFSTGGSLPLIWDAGQSAWISTTTYPFTGCNLYFRYDIGCGLSYSCTNDNSVPWIGAPLLGSISCGPPFSAGGYRIRSAPLGAACGCSFSEFQATVSS